MGDTNEKNIIHIPKLDFIPDHRGLGYVLFTCMQKFKNKIAQIDGRTGDKDTYGSLLDRCILTAIKMRSMGVGPDDIISTCTFNHLDSCVPYLATLFLGATISTLDPSLSMKDTALLLKQVTPKIVFVTPGALHTIESVAKELSTVFTIVVFGETEKHIPFSDFLRFSGEVDFTPYEVNDLKKTALIFFSSGSTGLPKGVCINHYAYLSQQTNFIDYGFSFDVSFTFSSLYWITASVFLCCSMLIGGTRIIIPKFDPVVIWTAIEKFKPTILAAIPFHYINMYSTKPYNVDLSSVRHILTGGAQLIKEQVMTITAMFPTSKLFYAYGQTEMALLITIFKPNNLKDMRLMASKPTSCGTGMFGITYKVVDVDTEQILGPNQIGELRLNSDYVPNGYYKTDSSEMWDENGWFRTGDLMYYDDDKCFYVVDRLKEFFKFQSWHIPPVLLEGILTSHPEILNAVVIGIPHDLDESHIMALVVLKNSNSKITPLEIEKYVEERVDDKKRLRGGVKIIDHIPVTPTGKMKRREIRDMYLRGEL